MKKFFSSICAMSMLLSLCIANAAQKSLVQHKSPYDHMSCDELKKEGQVVIDAIDDEHDNWFENDKICGGCTRKEILDAGSCSLFLPSLAVLGRSVHISHMHELNSQCSVLEMREPLILAAVWGLAYGALYSCITDKPKDLTPDLDKKLVQINEALKRKVKTD